MKIIPDRNSHFNSFYDRIPYTTDFTFDDKIKTYRPEVHTDHVPWSGKYTMHGDDYNNWNPEDENMF